MSFKSYAISNYVCFTFLEGCDLESSNYRNFYFEYFSGVSAKGTVKSGTRLKIGCDDGEEFEGFQKQTVFCKKGVISDVTSRCKEGKRFDFRTYICLYAWVSSSKLEPKSQKKESEIVLQ